MTALRAIVAATDLSAPARRAVDRAARLARSASASLTLVHVVSGSALDDLRRRLETGAGVERSIIDDARRRLDALAVEIGDRHAIGVEQRIVTGDPVEQIVEVARERRADLVVTGSLGAGLLRNRLVGSTAERVVKRSALPVLLVRQAPHEPYRRVLAPVDFSRWTRPAIEVATAVAPAAHFVLMHSVEVPLESRLRLAGVTDAAIERYRAAARDDANQRLRELAARAGLNDGAWTSVTSDGGSAWTQIVRLEREQECDLVVVGRHGRSAMEELLVGSTTNMVIGESSADVLVCTRAEAEDGHSA